MRMTIGKKLSLGFGVLVLLLVIFGIVVLINITDMDRQFEFVVTRDASVRTNAKELLELVVDMETGLRGFCITHKDEFLEPYNKAIHRFRELIEEEKKLVSDDPGQVKALEKIESLVNEWQEKTAKPEIAMARKVAKGTIHADYLQGVLAKGVGQGIMDGMRRIMDEMIKDFRTDGNIKGEFLTEAIAKAMVDQETGERGFLITGKEEFLEPYEIGKKHLEEELKALRTLVSNAHDRPATFNDLDALEKLANKWLKEIGEPGIELRRQVNLGQKTNQDIENFVIKGVGKATLDEMREIMDRMKDRFVKAENERGQRLLVQIAKDMVDQETGLRGFMLTGRDEFFEPYTSGQKLFKENVNELRKLNSNTYDVPSMKLSIDRLERLAGEWHEKAARPQIAARREMNKHPETIKDVATMVAAGTGKNMMDQIRDEFGNFIEGQDKNTAKRYASASAAAGGTERITIILVIFSIIFGSILAALIARRITKPLQTVVGRIDEIAGSAGDLTAEVPVATKDEIGDLAGAFNKMLGGLRGMVRQTLEVAEGVSSSAQGLSASAQEMNASVEEVSSTVQQIAKGSTDQAEATERASGSIEEMSSAIGQVSTSAQSAASVSAKNAESAKAGGEAAREAVKKMEQINAVVSDSAAAVKNLGERSQQIGEIVKVISNIADQTNLLALNAAIEAARAGDAGRGFAVVAEEVRKLAEESGKAADEISTLIANIQNETQKAVSAMEVGAREVGEGREIVNTAGRSFEEIVQRVEETAGMVQQISQASMQLAESSKSVVKSIEEVSSTAQESASAAQEASASTEEQTVSMEEMASSAQELADMAVGLKDLVSKFKLNGTPATPITSETVRAQPLKKARPPFRGTIGQRK